MKKHVMGLILVVLFTFFLVGCSADSTNNSSEDPAKSSSATETSKPTELKSVKIGFPGAANFMGGAAGIAQEKKFFDEELAKVGYKIEYVPFAAAGPAVNEALASKKIDLAIYADFPGLVLKSKQVPISLLAITDNHTNATLVVKQDSPIKSVKDLKGKKIAFTKGTFMQKYFLDLLALNGLTEKDVEIINVVTTDAASTLLSGNVDALIYVDNFVIPLLVDKSARQVDSTRLHPELRAQGVFVGVDSFINENPDVPAAVIKALNKAKEFVKNNPEEALKIWTKSGLSEEGLKILYGTDTAQYAKYFPLEITEESVAKLTSTKDFLLKQKLISNDYDIEQFANRTFYEKALK